MSPKSLPPWRRKERPKHLVRESMAIAVAFFCCVYLVFSQESGKPSSRRREKS